MASAQCHKPATTIEPCPPRSQKPTTTVANDICQPKTTQHSSLGQKISDMTSKAFKGHHGRHGNSQNQVQCYSQTEIESHGNTNSKKETHYYGQSQTQHDKKHGVSKTQITLTVVQAQITQTDEYEYPPYGTTTTCFGTHPRKHADPNNNRKDVNLFQRIRNGMSRHSNEGNNSSSSSSDSDSDNDKCPKQKTKASALNNEKCPKPKTKARVFDIFNCMHVELKQSLICFKGLVSLTSVFGCICRIDARRSREQDANKQSLCNKRREENMFTNKQCLYDII
ncbi:hypothetical protein AHAS_Ahas03G0235500 [Arachis hypogaea]